MGEFFLELGAICLLACLNGFFALAELAVLTARKGALVRLAGQGRRGARRALRLAEHPDRFLSSVQLGVTSLGVLAGMFGGAAFSRDLAAFLTALGMASQTALWMAYLAAAVLTSCLTIVLGELVPKRLAINHAESLAMWSAPIMAVFMRLASPAVDFLAFASRLVLRLLGQSGARDGLSEEDVRALAGEALSLGVLEKLEHEMIERVIRFGNRRVSSIMVYRADMDWLDAEAPDEENIARIRAANHSHFPVSRKTPGAVFGVAAVKELFNVYFRTGRLDVAKAAKEPRFIPETMRCLDALAMFKETGASLAVVVDEFGDVQGVATLRSIFQAIVGEIGESGRGGQDQAPETQDGVLMLDGGTPMDEIAELTSLGEEADGQGFSTLGGFVMARLGRVPKEGEGVTAGGWRFEVAAMDGRRVGKVRLVPPASGRHGGES